MRIWVDGVGEPRYTKAAVGLSLTLVILVWPLVWRFAAPALSPFVAVSAALAVRSPSVEWLAAVPMLVLVAVRRRFWCRRLCPVGWISESCGRLRGRTGGATPASGWPPGRFIALATLAGAAFGYPLFLWLDPLALFGGFFSIHRLGSPALPLLILVSVLWPGKWCSRLCPLGATQDMVALVLRRRTRNAVLPAARRAVLAACGGWLVAAFLPRLWTNGARRLRPPGAIGETAFKGGCIRCGSCSRACPAGIIQPAAEGRDPAGWLAPWLRFATTDYCRQDCNLCGRVCPTGVIRPLPLAEKNRHVIGIARVNREACWLSIEKECGVCVPRCPRQAAVDVFNYSAYQSEIRILTARCNGCGACVGICPPKAIVVEPLEGSA